MELRIKKPIVFSSGLENRIVINKDEIIIENSTLDRKDLIRLARNLDTQYDSFSCVVLQKMGGLSYEEY